MLTYSEYNQLHEVLKQFNWIDPDCLEIRDVEILVALFDLNKPQHGSSRFLQWLRDSREMGLINDEEQGRLVRSCFITSLT